MYGETIKKPKITFGNHFRTCPLKQVCCTEGSSVMVKISGFLARWTERTWNKCYRNEDRSLLWRYVVSTRMQFPLFRRN